MTGTLKQMLLLPTFDGQTRGVAAVSLTAVDLIKPSVTPGMTNVYLTGDHNVNYVGVDVEMAELVDRLKKLGMEFVDVTNGRKIMGAVAGQSNDGH